MTKIKVVFKVDTIEGPLQVVRFVSEWNPEVRGRLFSNLKRRNFGKPDSTGHKSELWAEEVSLVSVELPNAA